MQCKYRVDVIGLKKIMVEQGLDKILDLSEKSTVDRNTLSKILSEEVLPSTIAIGKLMTALEMSPEQAGKIFFAPTLRKT